MEINEVFDLLKQHNLTIGSIESITGGAFAARLTSTSGASEVYKGSIVSYSKEMKQQLVGVPKHLIDRYGVVSLQCAAAMASSGKQTLGVDVCISFTGNAGPTVLDDKDIGLVYIGLATLDKQVVVKEVNLDGDRQEVIKKAVEEGLDLLVSYLVQTK